MTEQLKVISEPEQRKQITVGNNVPKIVWAFDVQKGNGDAGKLSVELLLDPGAPPPGEGSTVTGDLEQNVYGWKLKLPRPGGGFGGRGRSPQETKAIQRQHSQEMALRFLATGGATLPYEKAPAGASGEEPIQENLAFVRRLTDWFEKDIAG